MVIRHAVGVASGGAFGPFADQEERRPGIRMRNAKPELLPEAGATKERTLEAVSSRPLFGQAWDAARSGPIAFLLLPPLLPTFV